MRFSSSLQWDVVFSKGIALGPLTFNLCFSTSIRYFSDKEFNQFGSTTGLLSLVHWFQFADDAAFIAGIENENSPILLTHLARWCSGQT